MNTLRAAACDLLVLCGGLGTRLRTAVSDRPKPMAMIGDRPFVGIVIEQFAQYGMRRIILCSGYMGNHFKEWYARNEHPYELFFSQESSPLGTAGALAQAGGLIRSNPFIAVNGDSLCTVDPEALLAFHAAKGGCATMVLTTASCRSDVGFVTMDEQARVTAFAEKQPGGSSRFHNAGVYVFERSLMEHCPAQRPCSLEADVLPALLSRGIFGFVSNTPLYDIGTPERLESFRASHMGTSSGQQSGKRAVEIESGLNHTRALGVPA